MTSRHVRRPVARGVPVLGAIFLVAAGVVLGLIYAWFINPVEFVDVDPSQLEPDQQRTYILMISLSYTADGDLTRARQRLGNLDLDDPGAALAEIADASVGELAESSVGAMANLAVALGGQPEIAGIYIETPTNAVPAVETPGVGFTLPPPAATITPTPDLPPTLTPTITPLGFELTPFTLTPTPDQGRFALVDLQPICDAEEPPGIMEVFVQDENGEGMPGVEILVEWGEGQDSFFTGLKPDRDPGYADFTMTKGRSYTARIMDGLTPASQRSNEMEPSDCVPFDGATTQLLSFRIVFRQIR